MIPALVAAVRTWQAAEEAFERARARYLRHTTSAAREAFGLALADLEVARAALRAIALPDEAYTDTRTAEESGLCCMARHAAAVPPWTCDCPCHTRTPDDQTGVS